jgi:hypothetical protein
MVAVILPVPLRSDSDSILSVSLRIPLAGRLRESSVVMPESIPLRASSVGTQFICSLPTCESIVRALRDLAALGQARVRWWRPAS